MSDTPQEGPLSLMEAVEALPEPETDTPEAETEEAPNAEPVESTEEVTAEPEDQQESEEAGPEEEAPQHLDIETYGDLTIPVKINGEVQSVSLAEAAKGYQLQSDYTRKSQELAQMRETTEVETRGLKEQLERQQQQIAELLASQTEQEPDWVQMAEEDPLGYSVEKAKWDAKQAQRNTAREQLEQRQRAELQQTMAREASALQEKAPELANPEGFLKLKRGVMEAYGFTAENIDQTLNHRVFLMAQDALRWRDSQQKVVDKVVAKTPKVVKPGTVRGKSEIKAEQVAARKQTLAKPHSVDEHLRALGIE